MKSVWVRTPQKSFFSWTKTIFKVDVRCDMFLMSVASYSRNHDGFTVYELLKFLDGCDVPTQLATISTWKQNPSFTGFIHIRQFPQGICDFKAAAEAAYGTSHGDLYHQKCQLSLRTFPSAITDAVTLSGNRASEALAPRGTETTDESHESGGGKPSSWCSPVMRYTDMALGHNQPIPKMGRWTLQ